MYKPIFDRNLLGIANEKNVLVLDDEVNKYGLPYKGMGIKPYQIMQHKDAWFKIQDFLKSGK